MMEGQLDALEKKIDELLADAEKQQRENSKDAATTTQNKSEAKSTDAAQQP